MTNGGIKLDKARFVQLFNDEQNRLVRYILIRKMKKISDIYKSWSCILRS